MESVAPRCFGERYARRRTEQFRCAGSNARRVRAERATVAHVAGVSRGVARGRVVHVSVGEGAVAPANPDRAGGDSVVGFERHGRIERRISRQLVRSDATYDSDRDPGPSRQWHKLGARSDRASLRSWDAGTEAQSATETLIGVGSHLGRSRIANAESGENGGGLAPFGPVAHYGRGPNIFRRNSPIQLLAVHK